MLLFVYSIALASFTSDERIYASKIMKVVFIRSVYPAEQKRLSIRNFCPPHSIYSAVFQIGKKKKKKILLHFVWGTEGGDAHYQLGLQKSASPLHSIDRH